MVRIVGFFLLVSTFGELLGLFIHDNQISRPMTNLLANYEYICLTSNWKKLFDKLKRALTCAAMMLWMYSICHQRFHVQCLHFIDSCARLFDKLLRALMGFDLSNNVLLNMEWLMLHKFRVRKECIV